MANNAEHRADGAPEYEYKLVCYPDRYELMPDGTYDGPKEMCQWMWVAK